MRHPVPFLSAAAVVALFTGGLVFSRPIGDGGVAFADVREAAATVTGPVRYRLRVERGEGRTSNHYTLLRLDADRKRSDFERPDRQGPAPTSIIVDFRKGESMTIWHDRKAAQVHPVYRGTGAWQPGNDWNPASDWFSHFRNLPDSAAQRLGEREIDGRKTTEFLVTIHGREFRAAVDSATKLPVRIEMHRAPAPGREKYLEVFTDFEFDADLDESLFSTDPPAGYAVTRRPRPKTMPDDVADARLVVSPETGIGPVKFGATEDEVVRLLGEPDWVEIKTKSGLPQQVESEEEENATDLFYYSRGFRLTVDDRFGLSSISCQSQAGSGAMVRDFRGSTPEGVRLGATWKEVLTTYGGWPKQTRKTFVDYPGRGMRFSFFDGFNDDRLVSIHVEPPRKAEWRSDRKEPADAAGQVSGPRGE